MRGDVGARGAQLRNRALHVRHAGVVQEDHVGQAALVSFAEICGRNDVGGDRGVWREVLHIRDGPGQRNGAPLRITSAAHLKFLCHVQQPPSRNFKWKAALELTDLLVPIPFRSSRKWVPRPCTNFGKCALVANEPSDISILKPGKRTTINFFQKRNLITILCRLPRRNRLTGFPNRILAECVRNASLRRAGVAAQLAWTAFGFAGWKQAEFAALQRFLNATCRY